MYNFTNQYIYFEHGYVLCMYFIPDILDFKTMIISSYLIYCQFVKLLNSVKLVDYTKSNKKPLKISL